MITEQGSGIQILPRRGLTGRCLRPPGSRDRLRTLAETPQLESPRPYRITRNTRLEGHNGLGFIHFHGTKIRAQSFDLARGLVKRYSKKAGGMHDLGCFVGLLLCVRRPFATSIFRHMPAAGMVCPQAASHSEDVHTVCSRVKRFNLASLYLTGTGTDQSFQRAAHW